jgi:hypothetical protein
MNVGQSQSLNIPTTMHETASTPKRRAFVHAHGCATVQKTPGIDRFVKQHRTLPLLPVLPKSHVPRTTEILKKIEKSDERSKKPPYL